MDYHVRSGKVQPCAAGHERNEEDRYLGIPVEPFALAEAVFCRPVEIAVRNADRFKLLAQDGELLYELRKDEHAVAAANRLVHDVQKRVDLAAARDLPQLHEKGEHLEFRLRPAALALKRSVVFALRFLGHGAV